jgi:hypothetical protein
MCLIPGMTRKKEENPSLEAIAKDALDLWQDHLSQYGASAKAKADLLHLLAPLGQLFTEWAMTMQNGTHAAKPGSKKAKKYALRTHAARAASKHGAKPVAKRAGSAAKSAKRKHKLGAGAGSSRSGTSGKRKPRA